MMPSAQAFARETQTISAVAVQVQDGVTRITMKGADQPIYTAFMREDPRRLIIELPDVTFKGIDTPIRVENGLLSTVELSAIGDAERARSMMRVSVGLLRDADYEVTPGNGEVVVEVRPSGATSGKTSAVPTEPSPLKASTKPPKPTASEGGMSGAVAPREATAEAGSGTDPRGNARATSPAGKILKVMRTSSGIEVVADGPIDNVDSFVLRDPDRIVVDFWGVKSTAKPNKQKFRDGRVAGVRIGTHADKVRVVLDMRGGSGAHKVVPMSSGVRIEIQSDLLSSTDSPSAADKPEAAVASGEPTTPSGRDKPAKASPEADSADSWSGVAKVLGARFESLSGVDRVVVEMDHKAKVLSVEPDSETLIVRILNSRIDKPSERRVDTHEFGGPIEMFSIFQTPDIKHEVRVVLRRRASMGAELTWEGSQLTIALVDSEARASLAPPAPEDASGSLAGDSEIPGGSESAPGAAPQSAAPEADASGDSDTPAGAPPASQIGELPASSGPSPATTEAYGGPLSEDSLLFGPADPASIDILEEGGFDEEKAYEGRRISLDFKDADIGNILRLIAEVSDLNVIAGDEVEGKVTIRLVDVPWDQALDVILLTKGLGFVRVGSVLRIAPIETLKVEREARLQERRAKEKLEDLIVKLQPVNYADVKEVSKLVERLLSARGSVNVDERTSTLIIKDIPSVIHEATALLKAIDTQTPQVLIEAKIVEASLNFSRALGAVWGLGYRANGSRGGGGDVHLGDGVVPDIINLPNSVQTNNFIASNPVTGALNGLLTLGLLGADEHLQLDLQLQAAEENRKGKVISSPRVVTLDNREAVIKQGVAIKFVEVTDDKITTSFVDAVLELKVTPHITANKSIIMQIRVSRNAPQLSAATGEVVGIDKNEATTEALVQDGETMVLGGIYVVENGHNRNKVPFLADIPLLGSAFRSYSVADERRELLIFVTPRVVLGPTPDL
jgi:type IV pilus assembly protein PilQ